MEPDDFVGSIGVKSEFKLISLVPDYRALQIIQQQGEKINSLLSSPDCDPLLRTMTKEDNFIKFRKSLNNVQEFIKHNASMTPENFEKQRCEQLALELKQNLGLTSKEIIMVLNQMPNNESLVELMFTGKFNKEQTSILCSLVNKYVSKNNDLESKRFQSEDQQIQK